VQAALTGGNGPAAQLAGALGAHVARRADWIESQSGPPDSWELDAIAVAAIHLCSSASPPRQLAYDALFLTDKIIDYRGLPSARAMLDVLHPFFADSAAADRSNAGWQRDLSVNHIKVGNVLSARGDLDGALREYRAGLEIRERLAAADRSDAGWQRDLWVSCWKIAGVREKMLAGDAGTWWKRAYDVLAAMVARELHVSPADLQVLDLLRAKLGPDGPKQ
jgi:hypothetical protein